MDENAQSEHLQRALRCSTALVLELQKDCSCSIAEFAWVFCQNMLSANSNTSKHNFHDTLRQSALLTEPWADVLNEALSTACTTLLDWLGSLQVHPKYSSAKNVWIRSATSYHELLRHCGSCIEALRLLSSRSDFADLSASHFQKHLVDLRMLVPLVW